MIIIHTYIHSYSHTHKHTHHAYGSIQASAWPSMAVLARCNSCSNLSGASAVMPREVIFESLRFSARTFVSALSTPQPASVRRHRASDKSVRFGTPVEREIDQPHQHRRQVCEHVSDFVFLVVLSARAIIMRMTERFICT